MLGGRASPNIKDSPGCVVDRLVVQISLIEGSYTRTIRLFEAYVSLLWKLSFRVHLPIFIYLFPYLFIYTYNVNIGPQTRTSRGS